MMYRSKSVLIFLCVTFGLWMGILGLPLEMSSGDDDAATETAVQQNEEEAKSEPAQSGPPKIMSTLERVEVDSYLKNKRAMQLQIKCVIYDGPCDIVGREVKKYIVFGLTGKCTSCSSRLRGSIEKVASHIQENYPQAWYDAIYRYLVAPTLGDSIKTSTVGSTKLEV